MPAEPFAHFTEADGELRTGCGHGAGRPAMLGSADKTQAIDHLTQELAYEYWHRMLFARFLAENHLLMHPDGVAVSLEECEELATSERAPNGFVLAARYASRMLPQIFRTDDVLLEIEFAPEQRLALEKLLASLPRETFLADDSLGWVYQFWQTKKKDEVNKSGDKIDGRTLPAVTQLFTEHYMVQFLLHNTIGAWWCARHGIQGLRAGRACRRARPRSRWSTSAGRTTARRRRARSRAGRSRSRSSRCSTPAAAAGISWWRRSTCSCRCGCTTRGCPRQDACDAVLRENLFGLELDPRCTQIAAFALALAAWKYPGADGQPLGYRPLPPLNIACSGQGVVGSKEEWAKFARTATAGSARGWSGSTTCSRRPRTSARCIDPRTVTEDLFALGFDTLRGTVERALKKIEARDDPDRAALGVAAQGIALAASLMSREFYACCDKRSISEERETIRYNM